MSPNKHNTGQPKRPDHTERPAGSRSPKHRGYRPDDAHAEHPGKKARWSAADRAARGKATYGTRADSPSRSTDRDQRPNWEPRGKDARRTEREWDARTRAGRDHHSARDDRAPFEDRAPRGERPNRSASSASDSRYRPGEPSRRNERGHHGDRGFDAPRGSSHARRESPRRDERPAYRDERPAYRDERPARRRGDDGYPSSRPRREHETHHERGRFADDTNRYQRRDRGRGDQHGGHGYLPEDDVVLERLQADAISAQDVAGVTFFDLGLGANIVRALADLGAESPFPIQAATIPHILAGRDVLGRGRTGSGKTIAFAAPLVERLMQLWSSAGKSGGKRQLGRAPRALILAPTRELALQIDRTVQPIARSVGLFTTQIYGGVPQGRQVGALSRGVDIVIGTPGRIEDLIAQGHLDLSQVVVSVLDEADHMCDLGFLEPVQRILRQTADGGQKLLFSATLDTGVAKLVDEFLDDPAVHEVSGEDQESSTIDHRVFLVDHRDKGAIIEQLADRRGKTLIFTRTRAFAEMLADQLDDAGIPAVSLHGDLNQSRRTRNLERLTSGRVDVLVATDVAARGIHVDDIDLVIQADAPDEYKTYLHRAGRTGRAGKQGTVVTLVPRQRQRRMGDLLQRAEITADFRPVRPGDTLLP